jgi:PAS domain S-box-containing protein
VSELKPLANLHGDNAAAVASPQALADRKELALVAIERTRMPMVVTNPREQDNPIVLANKAFLDLTGYAAEEIIGRNCRFLQGAGTSPAAIAEIRAALADERDIDVEVLNYRKDGSAFWNQLRLSAVHGDDGKLLYYFGSQDDVTRLRKVQTLEASEHRLLKEVDHRARNALTIVNSIVRLSRADDVTRYAAVVQQRVEALAGAHGLLADHGWQEVSLDQLVRAQVSPFGARRITLNGPEVGIPAPIVQPLALVIHELVVNAATHGALSAQVGKLNVSWQGTSQNEGFELHWHETGGPPPPARRQPGFGTVMVDGMIDKQLGGKIDRHWIETGLMMIITVPVPGSEQNKRGRWC